MIYLFYIQFHMIKKIERLINDPELRSKFAENAFLCMGDFQLDEITKQWKEILALLS